MKRVILAYCVLGAMGLLGASAQERAAGVMKAHWKDGRTAQYRVFPEAAGKLLFARGDAILEDNAEPTTWRQPPTGLFRNAQFVTVRDGQLRFEMTGILDGDQLFVLDELFCGENSETMTRLMLTTNTVPTNEDEAVRLTDLYLSLSEYHLEDPARFIALRPADLPTETAHVPRYSVADLLGVWHSPKVEYLPFGYAVDLFTTHPGSIPEHRRLTIGSRGLTDETNVAVHGAIKAQQADEAGLNSARKITFRLGVLMANGFTDDGGVMDTQQWTASDGPGVSRTHYHFKSRDSADRLMQGFLHNAIASIDSGLWFDSDGSIAGTRVVIIVPSEGKMRVVAAEAFEADSGASVLVLRCPCLRNLLAVPN
ncbi:MAG TPA: hypothetical protein VLY23_06445 [Candidatus Acidoferrum sp.]|nr:hypothetical protein [Candidatus Acidoferrum sp.]